MSTVCVSALPPNTWVKHLAKIMAQLAWPDGRS